jgi:predicted sulfurtransferase
VILFYKFVHLDANEFAKTIEYEIDNRYLLGRLLVAPDGLNGTLAGTKRDILSFEKYCVEHPVIENILLLSSSSSSSPLPSLFI